jgi:hypothetical protein
MELQVEQVKVMVYPDGRLDTANASQFLGLSEKTLAIMRCQGTGPRFIKRGRVFYFIEDLNSWITENPRCRYSFIAEDLHLLLLAGLPAHRCKNS